MRRIGWALLAATVVSAVAACGGGDDGGGGTQGSGRAPDLAGAANALVADLGEVEAVAAVLLALERGYELEQLLAAAAASTLEPDGVVVDEAGAAVEPAGEPLGVIDLERAVPAGTAFLARAGRAAGRPDETLLEAARRAIAGWEADGRRLDGADQVQRGGGYVLLLILNLRLKGYSEEQILEALLFGKTGIREFVAGSRLAFDRDYRPLEVAIVLECEVLVDEAGRPIAPELPRELAAEGCAYVVAAETRVTTQAEEEPPPEPAAGRVFVGAFAEDSGLVAAILSGPGSRVLANRVEIALQDAVAQVTAKLVVRSPVSTQGDAVICTAEVTVIDETATLAVKDDAIQGSFPFTQSDWRNLEGSGCREFPDASARATATVAARIESDAVTGTITLALPAGSYEAPFAASAGG